MMCGCMVYLCDGVVQLQCYGCDDSEVIWFIYCKDFNIILLQLVEDVGVCVYFYCCLYMVDFDVGYVCFIDDCDDQFYDICFDILIGVDGVGLVLCVVMNCKQLLDECIEFFDYFYKELEILLGLDGSFCIEVNVLYIWLCGYYMCIVLFNDEGIFIVILFLFNIGDFSFVIIIIGVQVEVLFVCDFFDVLLLILNLCCDWEEYFFGLFGILYFMYWYLQGCVVLFGDVVYVMVFFYGQGMNCVFEDCVVFVGYLFQQDIFVEVFVVFECDCKFNVEVIQQMVFENYLEMCDCVVDLVFLLQCEFEQVLQVCWLMCFVLYYMMVIFLYMFYVVVLVCIDL